MKRINAAMITRRSAIALCACGALGGFAGVALADMGDRGGRQDAGFGGSDEGGQRGGDFGGEFGGQMGGQAGGQVGGQGGGSLDKSDDETLAELLAETEDAFRQIDYTDAGSGLSFSYNLFVPAGAEESGVGATSADQNADAQNTEDLTYPLVLFITDSSVVGRDTTAALEQGYGALVWASDEDQAKHPCFVVAPEYPVNILNGEDDVTEYVDATLRLLDELQESYPINADRLYITGQSMGCMTALYLNGTYPDLFAASLYVDGQWPTDILTPLEEQTFFYFAAEGDDKASEGMANVKAMFDADGVAYGEITLNAKDPAEDINIAIEELIAEGYPAMFVSWEAGSVLPDGVSAGAMGSEHMYSFDHAYAISAVRDWLFEQTK